MAITLSRRDVLVMGLAGAAAGLLAGCSSGAASTGDVAGKTVGAMKDYTAGTQFKATKPLTFTMLFQDNPAYPYKKSWEIFKDIKKMTNVDLDLTIVPYDDYSDKRALLINSGKAPTILAKTYPGEEQQFVGGGAILAVSDYTKYMPNFTKKVKDWNLDADLDTIRQADGKFYVLPGLHETLSPDYTLAFRTDVLDELGIAVPQTWDEVRSALEKIREAHPSSIAPFSDRWLGACVLNVAAATFGTMAGANWGISNGLMFDQDKDEFYYTPTTDQYKQLVTYFAGLVSDGLMDPESFTQTDDQAQANFQTGKTYVISTNAQTLQLYRTAMDQNIGKGKYAIAKIPVPAGPLGKVLAGSRLENGIMLSSSAAKQDDFEALLQYVDWQWYSDKAQEFVKWGPEGKTWEKKDGKYQLIDGYNLKDYGFTTPHGKIDIREDLGFSCGNFTYGGTTAIVQSTMTDEELAWQKVMASYKQIPPAPAVPYTAAERQQATLKQTPIIDATNTATLNFILGKRSLDDWDDYVKELNDKGLKSYVDDANKAYQAAKKKA
ncbi:ABC transporter substrate-binding protein [Gryllotalpicola ginsengisoli]|uniref:ABC transporter substrate-binding protein n=1 Tax=Gryllotalpicola ginsengisoli TaxID=444608 RepID=UPI0003B3769A|nr:extracellular solute-binding protein [Gryllotalpicola ginsengisoli]